MKSEAIVQDLLGLADMKLRVESLGGGPGNLAWVFHVPIVTRRTSTYTFPTFLCKV